jgi:biotin carboxyl carrier protein
VLGQKLEKLSAEATRQEQSLQELQAYFQDQKSLLASVPSVWPTRGWVTSDFGSRLDPYTSERVMHAGLDIAGPHGKEIVAPSDGTVVFAGLEGGYGNVLVIDHGYGIKTRYGHLSAIRVKAGERVKRGDIVAAISVVGPSFRLAGPALRTARDAVARQTGLIQQIAAVNVAGWPVGTNHSICVRALGENRPKASPLPNSPLSGRKQPASASAIRPAAMNLETVLDDHIDDPLRNNDDLLRNLIVQCLLHRVES